MGTALSTTGNKHHTPCLIGLAISPLNPHAPHLVMGSSAEENDGVRVKRERVCCLLVLDSVTSTPQCIRQPRAPGCVHDVCVLVCECVLGRSRGFQPLNLRLRLLQHLGFLTWPRAIKTLDSLNPKP